MIRSSTKTVARVVLAIVIVVTMAHLAVACPTCSDGIAQNDPAQNSMAAGYFYSILFMMSMPFMILGTFGSFAYFSIRRARLNGQAPPDIS